MRGLHKTIVPGDAHEIANQCLRYNSHMRINNRPFFWRNAYQSGINMYVKDLFMGGVMLSCKQITHGIDIGITRFNFKRLIRSIPVAWKITLSTNGSEILDFENKYEALGDLEKVSKTVYDHLIQQESREAYGTADKVL